MLHLLTKGPWWFYVLQPVSFTCFYSLAPVGKLLGGSTYYSLLALPVSIPWPLLVNSLVALRTTACWHKKPSRYDSCLMYGLHIVYSPPVT